MLVTLNTDASFCPHTKEAGYAFWVSCNLGRYKKYGKFKTTVDNSTHAEIMAVVNGLHYIRTHPDLCNVVTKIIINTDCIALIDIMENPHLKLKKDKQKKMRQLRGKVQDYVGKFRGRKCDFELRHSASHKKVEDARGFVNAWCHDKAIKSLRGII